MGYRNPVNGHRFVALSMNLWNGSGPAKTYSAYHDEVLHRLLRGWLGLGHNPDRGNPADTPAMNVLAVLAHEYGHVLFYDTFKPLGGSVNYGNFCGDTFFSDSWQTLPTPPNWRLFGVPDGVHKPDDVQTTELVNLAGPVPSDPTRASALANRLYSLTGTGAPTGRWASLFATFSPDEDFVETFKHFVLRNAVGRPLQSMPVRVYDSTATPTPYTTHNIPGTCSQRPVLVHKLSCFAQRFCATQPSPDACSRCP